MNHFTKASLISIILFLVGCQTTPYDYSALMASKPKSILVLPPRNNSVEVIAPYTFLSTITRPLAEKGYYVYPVAVIDTFLKENGLPTPEEMNNVPLDKLQQQTGADAVLYVSINKWGQEYQVISSVAIVDSELKLIDARTGTLLWEARVKAKYNSSDGGGGLAGALVGAIVAQVAGSMSDRTPELSSQANHAVINNKYSGLLAGPRAPKKSR